MNHHFSLSRRQSIRRVGGTWLVILAALLATPSCKTKRPADPPASQPVPPTLPATTRAAATEPAGPHTFMDLVKLNYPECPTTQPLDIPLALNEAAHLILHEPIYLDPRGDLWITRSDAPTTLKVLQTSGNEQVHLTQDMVKYVHWHLDHGQFLPVLIEEAPGGRFETVALDHRRREVERFPIGSAGTDYEWSRAVSSGDDIIVPTQDRVVVFQHGENGQWNGIASPQLAALTKTGGSVTSTKDREGRRIAIQFALDYRGIYAWQPADIDGPHRQPGGLTVARFTDGKWTTLGPNADWPARMVHLIPLADGSVLQIAADDDAGKVKLSLTGYEPARVDAKIITHLIRELTNEEQAQRDAAYAQLQTYGSGIWDLLEKALPRQRGEAKMRVETLLKNKIETSLGSMTLLSNRLKIVARAVDGSVLCFCESGVAIPAGEDGELQNISPAWVSIRPGQAIQLLTGPAWLGLDPVHYQFYSVGGHWIVSDDIRGPRDFVGTFDLEPMLPKEFREYTVVIGSDRRGRWLFQKSRPVTISATQPADSTTLIVDPTIPAMTPRLPVWELVFSGGAVGWDRENFPAFKDAGGHEWVIRETGFELLKAKSDKFLTEPEDIPAWPAVARPATIPTTHPTTMATAIPTAGPTTVAANEPPPLLVDAQGRRYSGGLTDFRIVHRDGREVTWPLPGKAVGTGKVHLVIDKDGRLFLFNEPGRVVRIKPISGSSEPYAVDATFSRKIPNTDQFTRVWVDPSNRIVIAYDTNKLTILFPVGHVPKEIADKMPLDTEEDQSSPLPPREESQSRKR